MARLTSLFLGGYTDFGFYLLCRSAGLIMQRLFNLDRWAWSRGNLIFFHQCLEGGIDGCSGIDKGRCFRILDCNRDLDGTTSHMIGVKISAIVSISCYIEGNYSIYGRLFLDNWCAWLSSRCLGASRCYVVHVGFATAKTATISAKVLPFRFCELLKVGRGRRAGAGAGLWRLGGASRGMNHGMSRRHAETSLF